VEITRHKKPNRRFIAGGFFLAVSVLAHSAFASPSCSGRTPAGLTTLQTVMSTGRFIAYQPTSLQVHNGVSTNIDPSSVIEDLKALRPRFDGLITYTSRNGADQIPALAAKLGYRAVVMGIWDINDRKEVSNVVEAARQNPIVVGVSVGNEVVFAKRGSFADITKVMADLRSRSPQLAIATTEPFHIWLQAQARPTLEASDILLANVHPVFEPWYRGAPDANAAEFVVNVVNQLADVSCTPILVKETGPPTAPADKGFTPERQAGFWAALQKQFVPSGTRAFAYFSSFDAPWRVNDSHPVPGVFPEEAHWGLYDHTRRPKPSIAIIPPLQLTR
jgi:exo-beta-1,3-glucanase (GH17 family)